MNSIGTFIWKAYLLIWILELLDYYLPDIVAKLNHSYQVLVEMVLEHCTKESKNDFRACHNYIKPLDSVLRGAFALVLECRLTFIIVGVLAFRVVLEKALDCIFRARPAESHFSQSLSTCPDIMSTSKPFDSLPDDLVNHIVAFVEPMEATMVVTLLSKRFLNAVEKNSMDAVQRLVEAQSKMEMITLPHVDTEPDEYLSIFSDATLTKFIPPCHHNQYQRGGGRQLPARLLLEVAFLSCYVTVVGTKEVSGLYFPAGRHWYLHPCSYVNWCNFAKKDCKLHISQRKVSDTTKHWFISIVPGTPGGSSSDNDLFTAPVNENCELIPPVEGWVKKGPYELAQHMYVVHNFRPETVDHQITQVIKRIRREFERLQKQRQVQEEMAARQLEEIHAKKILAPIVRFCVIAIFTPTLWWVAFQVEKWVLQVEKEPVHPIASFLACICAFCFYEYVEATVFKSL